MSGHEQASVLVFLVFLAFVVAVVLITKGKK